jgi:hypothetical protein
MRSRRNRFVRFATNPGTDLHRADKASSRTHSWSAQAYHPRRVPGMALILEVQVLYGPDDRNR